jgi:autophagy-related protein 2
VQLSWELRAGSRGRRTTSTEVHFGQLEVLECLWPRGSSEPEYTEVRAEVGPGEIEKGWGAEEPA